MRRVFLIRHAQASFGASRYDELSALGHQQAQRVAKVLSARIGSVAHICVGAQQRQQQTLAGLGLANVPIVDEGWNEYDHERLLVCYDRSLTSPLAVRALVGQAPNPAQAFQALYRAALERWASGAHDSDYLESWSQFSSRVLAALHRALMHVDNQRNVLVVTSAGPICAVLQAVLQLPATATVRLQNRLVNASLTEVLAHRGSDSSFVFELQSFGELGHLCDEQNQSLVTYR